VRLLAALLSVLILCLPVLSHSVPMAGTDQDESPGATLPCHATAETGPDSAAGDCCDGICWDCSQCVPVAVTHDEEPAARDAMPGPRWLVILMDRPAAGFPDTPLRPPSALTS